MVASILGRNVYRVQGHDKIYPTQYILLHGLPATRKSTAIRIGTNILARAGYKRFAPDRMSRQAFAQEMYMMNQPDALGLAIEEILDLTSDYPHEMTVHASEFLDFMGQHDTDYLSLITTLWDCPPHYDNPKVSGKPVRLIKPTVNILGASTPKNMSLAFPTTAMDTGNLSRMIFIYADPVDKSQRILNPEIPTEEKIKAVLHRLEDISKLKGAMELSPAAEQALEYIYMEGDAHPDPRLLYYSGRRGTHLWKLAMTLAAMRNDLVISEHDVLEANTLLAVAEHTMSRALGNFGRGRQAAVTHDMIEWIRDRGFPIPLTEIYHQFNRDFASENEFQSVMIDLQQAGRIVPIKVGDDFLGFTVRDPEFPKWQQPLVLLDSLTPSERDIIGM